LKAGKRCRLCQALVITRDVTKLRDILACIRQFCGLRRTQDRGMKLPIRLGTDGFLDEFINRRKL